MAFVRLTVATGIALAKIAPALATINIESIASTKENPLIRLAFTYIAKVYFHLAVKTDLVVLQEFAGWQQIGDLRKDVASEITGDVSSDDVNGVGSRGRA